MSLERRVLAKVDRRLLSEMDHTEGVQLMNVAVSDAVWSTWRRYCEASGVSMGRGLAMLLFGEFASCEDASLPVEVLLWPPVGVSEIRCICLLV